MDVLKGKSPVNGPFSIATFDYRRVDHLDNFSLLGYSRSPEVSPSVIALASMGHQFFVIGPVITGGLRNDGDHWRSIFPLSIGVYQLHDTHSLGCPFLFIFSDQADLDKLNLLNRLGMTQHHDHYATS